MMRTTTKTLTVGALSLLIAACEMTPDLETRTFAVQHLQPHEVGELIDPYVYGEREGAPGALSVIEGAVTIRETADNLAQIERVLAQFDQARPDVRLHFQLIEADGFTESDPRIAQVEDQLRRLFPFQGYRLAGEATVTATDVTEFEQGLRASDGLFLIRGTVYRAGEEVTRLESVSLTSEDGWRLETSVNVRAGQTIVLGSSPKEGSSATLFLTVRAEEDAAAAGAEAR
jgi:hypothetical protein